jgi:hypothetical protein
MIYFLHIPRAVGAAVSSVIASAIAPQSLLRAETAIELAYHTDAELASHGAIAAATGYSLLQRLAAPLQTITFLRDPVDRVLSQYRACANQAADGHLQPNPWRAVLRGRRLDELLDDEHDPDIEQYFRNTQTFTLHSDLGIASRRAAQGQPDSAILEQAIAHLERMTFVGIVERMDESLQRMTARLGLGGAAPVPPRQSPSPAIELTPALAARIRECNALDVALYEHAVKRFSAESGA